MNRIRKFRKAANLTQYRLAKLSGVARTTIVRLEETGDRPRESTMNKLAKALGVEPDVLVGVVDEKYKWNDASLYDPREVGYYLCACRRKYLKDYRYKVLNWLNGKWVDVSTDGQVVEYVDREKIIWWAEIAAPPELPKRLGNKARISE